MATAVPIYKYTEVLYKLVEGGTPVENLNANTLKDLGGHAERRKEAVRLFKENFIDSDGTLISIPPEFEGFMTTISELIMTMPLIAIQTVKMDSQRQLQNAHDALKEKTSENAETSEKLLAKIEENEVLTNKHIDLTKQMEELQSKLAQLTLDYQELEKENLALDGKLTNAKSESSQLSSQIETLKEANVTLKGISKMYQEQVEVVENLRIENVEVKEKLSAQKDHSREQDEELVKIRVANEKLKLIADKLPGVESKLSTTVTMCESLQIENHTLKDSLEKAGKIKNEYESLVKENQTNLVRIGDLELETQSISRVNEDLKGRLTSSENSNLHYKGQIESLQEINDLLRANIKTHQ